MGVGAVVEPSGAACDHYNRFREDFDHARALNHNAHRFSLEWSRIEPEEGRFSAEGLAHYRDVLLALHQRGMEPVVTIYHYTLPKWLADKGDGDRWTFIFLHLWQVSRAISEGIPVVGYLHWSLLDNYEWAEGFRGRFGLIEVDYATQRRTVRESACRLADVIARNEL